MKLSIVVRISSMRVREFCIENKFYTRGDCEAYENLLYNICEPFAAYEVGSEELKEKMLEIAEDIVEHSEPLTYDHYEDVAIVCERLMKKFIAVFYN